MNPESARVNSKAPQPVNNLAVVLTLAGATALSNFSSFAFLPSIFAVGIGLQTSVTSIQSTVFVYQWLFAIATLGAGQMADRYDKSHVLMFGTCLVLLGGAGAAMATNFSQFLLWRCVQAVGAAITFVSARAIAADVVDRSWLVTAMAWIAGTSSLASMTAPVLGGWIEQMANWRYTFVLVAVYALTVAVFIWRLVLPLTRKAARDPLAPPPPRAPFRWGDVLPSGKVMRCCCAIGMNSFSFHLFMATAPVLLPRLYGFTPGEVGTAMIAPTLGFVAAMPLSNLVARRSRQPIHWLMRGALGMLAVVGFTLAAFSWFGLPPIMLLATVFFAGFTNAFVVPMGFAAVTMLDEGKAGSVSGMLAFIQFVIGGAAGLLALGLTELDFTAVGLTVCAGAALGTLLVPTFPKGMHLAAKRQ